MCSADPRAEEERRNAASTNDEGQREFHLTLADIFHARHLMSDADNGVVDAFSDEVQLLHGEALLERKLQDRSLLSAAGPMGLGSARRGIRRSPSESGLNLR
jgi:hypothetical protein